MPRMKSTIALALAALSSIATASPEIRHSPDASPIVNLPQGTFAGESYDRVTAFLGLPYAAAPIGSQRWAPPGPPPVERSLRQARQFGPSCPQELRDTPMMAWTMEYLPPRAPGMSEDCLSLNVWKPALPVASGAKSALPVLVFLHGGGFTSGSTSVPIYDGAKLAGRGMIVVTANYRLGTLG
ncbi:MAG: carboxylesterase family protein, partial [Alphaproteobacteria bacterium]